MFDKLTAHNEEAIILHNQIRKIFKEESQNFFNERLKWKSDVKMQMDQQDRIINGVTKVTDRCKNRLELTLETLASLTESVIMMHMVQQNLTEDITKVNLISTKPEHDLILKDRQTTVSPEKKKLKPGEVDAINLEME